MVGGAPGRQVLRLQASVPACRWAPGRRYVCVVLLPTIVQTQYTVLLVQLYVSRVTLLPIIYVFGRLNSHKDAKADFP